MKLLLDTHVWLWRELEPQRMPDWMDDALARPSNELHLSPVSLWELAQLCEKGRLELDQPWRDWWDENLRRREYTPAPLSFAAVAAAADLRLAHRDPFDWLLASTARHYGLALVTADRQMQGGSGFRILRPA